MRLMLMAVVLSLLSNSAFAQLLPPAPPEAPPGRSAEPLSERAVRRLTRVYVQGTDGTEEWSGRIVGLDEQAITLLDDGHRFAVPLARVRRIETAGDSLANGVRIGAAIGGIYCLLVCGLAMENAGALVTVAALTAATGAGIGAAFDASVRGRTTIYLRAASVRSASPQANVGPPRAAVRLALRF